MPRGFAAQFPIKYEFNEEEFDRISKLAQLQLEDAQEDLEEAKTGGASKSSKSKSGTTINNTTESVFRVTST